MHFHFFVDPSEEIWLGGCLCDEKVTDRVYDAETGAEEEEYY